MDGMVCGSVTVLLARLQKLKERAAAADEQCSSCKIGSPEAHALELASEAAEKAWWDLEAFIADAPSASLDEVIGKLEIGCSALLEEAGGRICDLPTHERLVISALADLRRMRAVPAPRSAPR